MWKTIISLIFVTTNLAFAQGNEPALKVRALLLAPGGLNIDLYTMVLETKKLTGPILVGARGISDPVDPGARKFSFAIPDANTESGYRPVSKIILPAAGDDFIVLLEPAGEKFEAHIVSGKSPRFKNDSMMFFNATDVPIGATLGEEKVVIPPRKPVLGKAPSKGERPWYQVTFYAPQPDGSARMFSNTRWPYRNSTRSYLFFYRSEPSGRITFQAVDESIEAPQG